MKHSYVVLSVTLSTITGKRIKLENLDKTHQTMNKESLKEIILRKFNGGKDFGKYVKCELETKWI